MKYKSNLINKAIQLKRVLFLFSFSLLSFAIFACQDASNTQVENKNNTATRLKLSYPSWVEIYSSALPEPSDNLLTVEGVDLGRRLFYDTKLSGDMTQSCSSCHVQANNFTDPNPFSKGIKGDLGNRNAMTIVNLAWSKKFFWDGRRNTLEEQAHDPVTNPIEMAADWNVVIDRLQKDHNYPGLFKKAFNTDTISVDLVTKAIAQFERTLISFNSRYDKFVFENDTNVFNQQEKRGYKIFMGKGDCGHCHNDVMLTDYALRNNGMDLEFKDKGLGEFSKLSSDDGKFKVPTLRNIEVSAPYMHDSRFKTLKEVIIHYSNDVKSNSPNLDPNMIALKNSIKLSSEEVEDLEAFLKTMTDQSFLTNKNFSNPFTK
jgi:cytochrome c peroxidase